MNRLLYAKTRRGTTLPVLASILSLVIGAISLTPSAGAPPDEGRLATRAELGEMQGAGEYRICLQQIGRILRSGNVDKNYDRYDLLLLRGDCLLHLEDPATAQVAYAAAATATAPEQAREGRATVLLLQRSRKMIYVPRGDDAAGDGISLATREGRIKALRALLRDDLRADQPAFDRAMKAENLVPVWDVLPTLGDLYAVERTATGGDKQLRPILEAVGEHVRKLIDQELDVSEPSIAAVETRANQRVDYPASAGGRRWGGSVRRGLHTSDRQQLRDLVDYLQRIADTARQGQQLAAFFDADTTPWDPLSARASKAVRYAQDVLDAE